MELQTKIQDAYVKEDHEHLGLLAERTTLDEYRERTRQRNNRA